MEGTLLHISLILSAIKMKFDQILVYLVANISNMFSAQCWIRKLVPGPFMILMK